MTTAGAAEAASKRESVPDEKRNADLTKFMRRAKRRGAASCKVISPSHVRTAEWVRLKCQYGCPGYESCLTCPPYSPDASQTPKILDGSARALLIQFVIEPEQDQPDVRRIAAKLEREMFLDGYYKAFAMACGPCEICEECTLDFCVESYLARPSMEACGIDVFATARGAGYPIEVVTSDDQVQNRYGLILVD